MINYLETFIKDIQKSLPEGAIIEVNDNNEIVLTFEELRPISSLLFSVSNNNCFLNAMDYDDFLKDIDLERFYGPDTTPLERANILNGVINYLVEREIPVMKNTIHNQNLRYNLIEGCNNPQNSI